jgi:signal transduction histidine kinase
MSELRTSTRCYLGTLAIATAGVAVAAWFQSTPPDLGGVFLAIALCALQALADFFPLELAPQQKFSLHTAVVFAAVLLVDPVTAMAIAGVGTLIAQVVRRQPGVQVLFNTCQVALQAGVAGLVVMQADLPEGVVSINRVDTIVAVVGAALVIETIDIAAVGIVVRLQAGQSVWSLFSDVPAGSLLDDLSQFVFGYMTAIAVEANAWTLPVVVVLAYQLHRAGRRSLAAQRYERLLRAESERTAHARQEFLLTASHELKTPITAVKMAAHLLDRALVQRRPAFRPDQTSILRWRDQLLLGIQRLETLVADLLDAARIQQGQLRLRPEPIDLVALASAVIERFEHAPERTRFHRLILDAPERVDGVWDASGLDQVLTNLVSNALKYSPDGGDVRLEIRPDADEVVVSVSDTGIGISEELLGNLFSPFVRGSDPHYGIGGTGLGLYITKRIVEQHDGVITIESLPSIGTSVSVTLPRSPSAETVPHTSPAEIPVPHDD